MSGRRRLHPRRDALAEKREPPVVHGRVPPHDLDAEAAVLSAILLERSALDQVLEILKPQHFYSDANGRIYEACVELALCGRPIDIIEVAAWLRDRERLQQIGGVAYLGSLADATPAVANVLAHARVVYEKWRIRMCIATLQRFTAVAYGDYGEPQAFLDEVEQGVYEIARSPSSSTTVPAAVALRELFEDVMAAADRGDRYTGVESGYPDLDRALAGFHEGDLVILAARPGMGKTSFALNVAVNVATVRNVEIPCDGGSVIEQRPGYGVFVQSLEMPRKQLGGRLVCAEGRVDVGRLRRASELQPRDWSLLTNAAAEVSQLPLWIDDKAGCTVLDLRAKVRRVQAQYNRPATKDDPGRRVALVIVDYLQLMHGREDAPNREQEISEISRGLKELAKELGVCVLALSQLNRSVETRADKRPMLSDLRESGALEQDADQVIFVYRDEYYHPHTTNARGVAELIVAKNRHGATTTVLVRFAASSTRFDSLTEREYEELAR